MYVEFYGASEGVTGSLHRVHVNDADVLLDCGLFQGHRADANRLNRELPRWAPEAECLVLSHAHLDHSGNTPSLVKAGFKGNVFCTPPTRDLCSVMFRDSAMIQRQDARYLNKKLQRSGSEELIEPLYTAEEAESAVQRMLSIPYHRSLKIAPGVTLTFYDAGHVLGSALVCLDLAEQGKRARLLFTGDLGRAELPLLANPEIVSGVDALITESTYGDRTHPPLTELDDELASIITKTVERGGRVYFPAFALERSQELLFAFKRLHEAGRLPSVPIYVDSPLAISITEIYKLHPESLAQDIRQRIFDRDDPFSPPGLRYISDIAGSTAIQRDGESCIVMAGAGMCEGGRILHHFTHGLGEPKNAVAIAGFMAQHTLGRQIAEGRPRVKVFGVERDVRATVHTLRSLSAHADGDDLVAFAKATARAGNLRQVAVVHGEAEPKHALATRLSEIGVSKVLESSKGLRMDL